jgi:hypothetical protein
MPAGLVDGLSGIAKTLAIAAPSSRLTGCEAAFKVFLLFIRWLTCQKPLTCVSYRLKSSTS